MNLLPITLISLFIPMLTVAEARARILEIFSPLPTERVPLENAAGHVLAEAIVSTENLPPFANSSMDGFAVRVAEVSSATLEVPVTLPVSGDIPAGSLDVKPLKPGTAMRIMTGAPLPEGAEAVVPVEETDVKRDSNALPAAVKIFKAAGWHANFRPAGQDVQAGQLVMAQGTLLRPAAIGILAALGHAQVQVYAQPVVALLSSGDELVPVTATPRPGQIRDSNSYSLAAAIEQYGGRVVRLGVAQDTLEDVRAKLAQAEASGAHFILSSAGVSVGAYDFVKEAVEAAGALAFWKVKMRPGKPLAVGRVGQLPFIGLPGNPVSALVGMEVFVRPVLLKLSGRTTPERFTVMAALSEPFESDGRETYLRVTLERQGEGFIAHSTGQQGSNIITSLVRADGLMIIPEGTTIVPAGAQLSVWVLDVR